MKRILAAAILVAAFFPTFVMGASVEVYPYMTSSHGGTANSTNLNSCITAAGQQQCDSGVPVFQIPDGSTYSVTVTPPAGYSYSMDGFCSGAAVSEGMMVCNVSYVDGAPVQAPVITSAPQPIEQPQQQTAAPAQSLAVPIATKSGLTADQIAAVIGILRAFGVDEATIALVQTDL